MNTRGPHDATWGDLSFDDRVAARKKPLVSFNIVVLRDGTIQSDVQTHDNSYADVAVGLGAVKKEIERVFSERKNCPYYPASREQADKKIVRSAS